jgi:hypothetical protein
LRHYRAHDPARSAPRAKPALPAVNRKVVLKTALEAFGVHVIVDARSALGDGASQNVNDAVV